MKKTILFLCFIFALFASVSAQSSFKKTSANPTGAILNTSIDTLSYTMTGVATTISITPTYTRATGTMAGTAILAKSVDGVYWVNTDTLTLTNAATNSTLWERVSAARYWRIIRSGATTVTGTSSAKISAGY